MVDEFTKIVPSAFRPFIDHHQGLLTIWKKYANAELGKTELLMNLKKQNLIHRNRILSRNTNIEKKNLIAFQNIVTIFKIDSIEFSFCFLLFFFFLFFFLSNVSVYYSPLIHRVLVYLWYTISDIILWWVGT